VLLQLPNTMAGTCLTNDGDQRHVKWEACDATVEAHQRWVYDAASQTFRSASDPAACLDLFDTPNPEALQLAELGTDPDSARLGTWRCHSHAPNQRFQYDVRPRPNRSSHAHITCPSHAHIACPHHMPTSHAHVTCPSHAHIACPHHMDICSSHTHHSPHAHH